MPVLEPTVLDLHQYSIRHIGPKATVYPDTIGQEYTVLNRSDMVARPLPPCNIPNTVDFASGKWDGRLNDAGDATIIWPNKEASDGQPWRQRFDPTSKLQWLEIWVDEFLESVVCITKVTPDRNQVQVDGYDGIQMLKSAYTRDWIWTGSPRDTFYRGTCVWVPVLADSFSASEQGGQWVDPLFVINPTSPNADASVTASAAGLNLSTFGGGSTYYTASITAAETVSLGSTWSASLNVSQATWTSSGTSDAVLTFNLYFADRDRISSAAVTVTLSAPADYAGSDTTNPVLGFQIQANLIGHSSYSFIDYVVIAAAPTYGLLVESDGRWVTFYCNGQLVAQADWDYDTNTLPCTASVTVGAKANTTAIISGILLSTLSPFLMTGTDQGDYVLPGGTSSDSPPYSSAYSSGGLHARYYNDGDLSGDPYRIYKILSPSRSQAYSGSGTAAEYQNQVDPQVNAQSAALGAPGSGPYQNWSAKWFGSIYLPLASYPGTYVFKLVTSVNAITRLWVGQTQLGTQIIDQFDGFGEGTSLGNLVSTTLNGTLPYGQGTVARDGWYPILLEYAVDSTPGGAPILSFTPPSSYTDPGGTALTGGASVVIPSTSLSPLGCDDNRYQGTSHYDLTQKTAVAFGYQYALEPYQLESGLFPGVAAPRAVRSTTLSDGASVTTGEGTNYDTIVEPDDSQRKEGMINYSQTLDGTDECSSIQGNGAGFQNGNTGQLQANVYDATKLQTSLFDIQGWQDVADAAFSSVLANVLNSQLGLRQSPWQSVSGDPVARERRAFTWPLTGALQNMRWRPGDGVRVAARDINLQDTVPRQLLLVTRNIHPNGATSTQVNFASRPKSQAYSQRQAISAALRPLRNYQKQLVTLNGALTQGSISGGSGNVGSVDSTLILLTNDILVHCYLRVVGIAGTSPSWGIATYGGGWNDETSSLNGPWSASPMQINLSPVAAASAASNLYALAVTLINKSSNAISSYNIQVFADVLR